MLIGCEPRAFLVASASPPATHSATIENRFVFLGVKSAAILCARSTPSNFAPIRKIAFAERSFRSSVHRCTLHIFHVSNACVSISSFASLFAAVRIAEAVSHV